MSMDMRNVRKPYIGDGFMQFFYSGELAWKHLKNNKCKMDPKPMKFHEHSTYSQWVVSDAVATCMANAFAESPIGRVKLNKEYIASMFKDYDQALEFDTSSIAKHLPLFK